MRSTPFTHRVVTVLWLALGALCLPGGARADALDEARRTGVLVWGGDQEGGGPFIFPREDAPEQVTGFEVDLADRLAAYLKVKAQFQQGQWDKLLDMLRTAKVAVVLNGYEWRAERAEQFEASIPYYVYGLQLLARTDDATLKTLDDLRVKRADGGRRKLGVLTGSAAESWLRETYGETIDLITYDGNTDSMHDVENGKLDATLQDTPIARFYAPQFPQLRFVDAPVAPGHYVLFVRKGEPALLTAINEFLIVFHRSGEMKRLYSRYGIWDEAQSGLAQIYENARYFGYLRSVTAPVNDQGDTATTTLPDAEEVRREPVRKRGWSIVEQYFPTLVKAAGMTVVLALVSFPLAILLGLLVALGRLYGPTWLRLPLSLYVEVLRGTPLMLQLYFIFFLLPEVGINVPAFATAVIGLAVNYSAYESEIYRAGLQSIPQGQMEAALSLGMSRPLALRRVIVPQAVRVVIPPVVNDFIALFKDTSVCSVVTIIELTKRFTVLSMNTQAIIEMMAMTCVLYMLMSYPLSLLSRAVERRLGVGGQA